MVERVYDDFSRAGDWPGTRWLKFRTPAKDLWDPATRVDCPGAPDNTLTIEAPRFTASHPPHHVKALMLSSERFDLARTRRFTVRVEMAVSIYGTENNPFGAEPGDPRLATGALVIIDIQSGLVFDFLVTNTRICPLYERLPLARDRLGPYPAFTSFATASIPTAKGQWHSYAISYDAEAAETVWRADDQVVRRERPIGAAPGRSRPVVYPTGIQFGGGLFTILDGISQDKEEAADTPPIPGLMGDWSQELFGQGGAVSYRNFRINVD